MLQSKSLIGEHSIGFSPPSLLRETLIDAWDEPVKNADSSIDNISHSSTATSVVFSYHYITYIFNCSLLVNSDIVSDDISHIAVL